MTEHYDVIIIGGMVKLTHCETITRYGGRRTASPSSLMPPLLYR